jgi:hypothetical protein
MTGGFTYLPGYTLTPAQPPAGSSYPPASPHRLPTTHQVPPSPRTVRRRPELPGLAQQGSAWTLLRGYGNINPLSIDYASRPRLRPRLTQGGLAWPWNPWSSGGRVSHPAFATHACILTPTTSTARSRGCFPGGRTLPYPPTHLDRPDTARNHLTSELLRTLSRMAASKPTSWLSMRPHILSHLAHA